MVNSPDINRWVFDSSLVKDPSKDLKRRSDALQARIEEIIRETDATLQYNICELLIRTLSEPSKLLLLSKALSRIAELKPKLDEINKRRNAIDVVVEHTGWFASIFADLTPDDEDLVMLLDESQDNDD